MNFKFWLRLKRLPRLLALPVPEPLQQASRILSVQRNIVLPTRCMVTAIVLYYLFYAHWLDQQAAATPREVVLETLQRFFLFYLIFNAIAAILLVLRRFPPSLVQWLVFMVGLLDGLLLAGLTIETGGFESNLFWVFPGLIIINALSIPLATPQIVLNLALSIFYLGAGLANTSVNDNDMQTGPLPYRHGTATFAEDDIKDLPAFAVKLQKHADPVSQFLWDRFSEPTHQVILAFTSAGTNADYKKFETTVVDELNNVIRNGIIYQKARFADTTLSPETQSMFGPDLQGDRLMRFNRLLLEDAYPSEIVKNHKLKPYQLGFMGRTAPPPTPVEPETSSESFFLRLLILWLLTASCFGVQLLAFRDRQAEQDAQDAAARNSELKAAGRLAAEIAHQLKNPLGIINNAAFSLQRGLREGKKDVSQQLDIIREEVERSDRIITQLMGYAQLSEGRVEKLSVPEELDRALAEVFPPGTYPTRIHRNYGQNLPGLMMQRIHLSAVFVNLLQNAREALGGRGNIHISVRSHGDNEVEAIFDDDGPGIAPDKLSRIFEAYFTSKEKGTGLGLAIVKHNIELYGGAVRVESKLGKGARFILLFSARTFVK
ncbi:MAG: Integral rane sensor signal transduction histidine kinase [Pedosphaera sp.]|nr:Integral rane sensor signal transduction histidine kinase [Pedosphaera sp.]